MPADAADSQARPARSDRAPRPDGTGRPGGPQGPAGPPGSSPTITVTNNNNNTVNVTVTVTGGPAESITTPGTVPASPPAISVAPGPGAGQFTITVNGVPTTITIPERPGCVNTRKSAILGPLPLRFRNGMRIGVTSKGHTQFATVNAQHKVRVQLGQLPCGVYPLVIRPQPRRPGFKPAWRIWSLTGGNTLNRFWVPGFLQVSGPGQKLND